jgi:hypothetical protein
MRTLCSLLTAAALTCLGCTSTTAGSGAAQESATCTWPTSADTATQGGGAGYTGCLPSTPGQICQQASDGSSSCKPICGAGDYELSCHGSGGGPDPDASLGCSVIPIPTPSNATFYCCPCAQ